MNTKVLLTLGFSGCLLLSAAGAEVTFQSVGISDQPAPGLNSNVNFSQFTSFSLADDGRIAFTGNARGPGITATNRQGIWAGLPGGLALIARTGMPAPGTGEGAVFKYFWAPNLDNHQYLGFFALLEGSGISPTNSAYGTATSLWIASANPTLGYLDWIIPDPLRAANPFPFSSTGSGEQLGYVINNVACAVELYGPDIGATNNRAILAGSPTNWVLAARTGFPAPGTSGNFTSFPIDPRRMSLTPDGKVAFQATVEGFSGFPGVWFGNNEAVEAVMLPNQPAPASLLGPGYTFGFVGDTVEVNGRGELAFATSLNGPGLNSTNSDFIIAGTPGALRIVAQSGQPAWGIPGAFYRSYSGGASAFGYVLLGADGTAAFVASYSTNGHDFGLWLASTNGTTPILLMHTGQQAPGAPTGVVFTNSFQFLPPIEEVYMNARNQIVFRSVVGGPGIGDTNRSGLWLAEPDGSVNLLVRAGDMFDVGDGVQRQLQNVTFGINAPRMACPEDGRTCPFNNRGEAAFWATWQNPPGPPDFGGSRQGLFIARTGIVLSGARAGNDIRISFPTISGKNYRADYSASLSPPSWSPLAASVPGTGGEVIVTDTNASPVEARFYRVVRLD